MKPVFRKPDPGRWNLEKLAESSKEDDALTQAGLASWAEELDAEDSG
jgi:hypothetical protein